MDSKHRKQDGIAILCDLRIAGCGGNRITDAAVNVDVYGLARARILRCDPRRIEVGAGEGCEERENERQDRREALLQHVHPSPRLEASIPQHCEGKALRNGPRGYTATPFALFHPTPFPPMKKYISAFVPLALALLLTACGNKGPLVRPAPDAPPPAESTT